MGFWLRQICVSDEVFTTVQRSLTTLGVKGFGGASLCHEGRRRQVLLVFLVVSDHSIGVALDVLLGGGSSPNGSLATFLDLASLVFFKLHHFFY